MVALASVFFRREPSATGSLHKCANVAVDNYQRSRYKDRRKREKGNGEMEKCSMVKTVPKP